MNQVTVRNNFSVPTGAELMEISTVCKALATAPFYQKLGAGGLMAIWLTAREMGLPVMMCLNGGLYTFNGQVTLSAQLINMLIVNAGHRADIIHLDNTRCKINFVRGDRTGDSAIMPYEFTIDDAQKAGYMNKDNWKKHTRDMLFARCLSGGARKHMPDVLMNAYVHGELGPEDATIIPITPEVAQKDVIDQEVIDNLNLFNEVHPGKMEYLDVVVSVSNQPKHIIASQAVQYVEKFNESYSLWLSKKNDCKGKPTSMDEVV